MDFIFPQMLMSKIEKEKAGIMADIEAGRKLQKDKNAPSFIAQNIHDLENKFKNTNDLAQAKHTKLKVSLLQQSIYVQLTGHFSNKLVELIEKQ